MYNVAISRNMQHAKIIISWYQFDTKVYVQHHYESNYNRVSRTGQKRSDVSKCKRYFFHFFSVSFLVSNVIIWCLKEQFKFELYKSAKNKPLCKAYLHLVRLVKMTIIQSKGQNSIQEFTKCKELTYRGRKKLLLHNFVFVCKNLLDVKFWDFDNFFIFENNLKNKNFWIL